MRAAEQPATGRAVPSGDDRLSDLDEALLYLERPNQPMQIGCVAEIDGRFELDELVATLETRLAPLPRFRQRPAHSPLNLRGVRWENDPGFDIRHHVRHVALPQPADQDTLRHVVETLFATPLPPDRPLWEIHLIDGLPGHRSALLCKVHHCMSDGISALGVLEQMADPVTGDGAPEQAAREAESTTSDRPAAGADAGAGAAQRSLPGAIGGLLDRLRALAEPASIFTAVRDVGAAIDAVASFVQEPITALPFHGKLGHGRRMIWRSFPFDEFDSLRIAGDCTINDAVLTVIAGALRSYLDEEGVCPDDARVRMLVPVSVRGQTDTPEMGNLITAVFPWLPVDEEDPLERLARVRQEMRAIKGREMGRATGILLGLLGLLPSAVEAAAFRLLPDVPLVSAACTNVRGPAQPLRLLGRRIAEIHPIMNLFQGVGLAFAVASYAGRLSICAATDPRLLPDGERLLDALEESIYELRTEHWRTSKALRLASGLAEHARADGRGRRDPAVESSGARRVAKQIGSIPVLAEADLRFDGGAAPAPASPIAADERRAHDEGDGAANVEHDRDVVRRLLG